VRLLAPNIFWHAASPLFRAADALASGSQAVISQFRDTADLVLRNERLEEETIALTNENNALRLELSALGALPDDAASDGILAGTVARPPTSPYDTLVVAQGSAAGVTRGMGAFGQGGVPLGVVSAVLKDFSRVTLFSSSGMQLDAWVGERRVPLTVYGAGGGTMRATVARSAEISAGDAVFAPGPGMLPVGTVVRVDSDPSSPSARVQIQPAVNLFSIDWVLLRAAGAALAETLFAEADMP
jgi:cell shape-determining protein MreC